ncbi:MAG TPA: glutathione binding-like protein [Xanthobacteraceae bacterium]|nr:glutathione binding-like protein [Xanthobacteraceae bacterium]
MDLYFSPLACSLASRIALYEAGAEATFLEVDPKTKRIMDDGSDYLKVYPLGLVPALRMDDGALLTENAAILQYVAAQFPAANLAPKDGVARARLQQWLCFIGTELHKALFVPLFDKKAPQGLAEHVQAKGESRLAYLNDYLAGRDYLLDQFTVADAYLYTVLNWSMATPVKFDRFPAIQSYFTRLQQRPSIKRAFSEELALYKAELARHKAAA